jgi:methyltransferase (TIGR00027 family)
MTSFSSAVLTARRAAATQAGTTLVNDAHARLFVDDPALLQRCVAEAGAVHAVLLRHRLFEDYMLQPPVPVTQAVLLGAGNDTKFQRHPRLRRLAWFEVDSPESVARKRATLQAHGLPMPRFIPLRVLTLNDLAGLLGQLDPAEPTLVLAEGLFMYHERKFVELLVKAFNAHLEAPACWAFDVVDPSAASDQANRQLAARLALQGEVVRSAMSAEDVKQLFPADVWGLQCHAPETLANHYLAQALPRGLGRAWRSPIPFRCCLAFPQGAAWQLPLMA